MLLQVECQQRWRQSEAGRQKPHMMRAPSRETSAWRLPGGLCPLCSSLLYRSIHFWGLKITHGTHRNCCSAQCFCCGALCKIPIQTYIFSIEVPLYQRKVVAPLQEWSSRLDFSMQPPLHSVINELLQTASGYPVKKKWIKKKWIKQSRFTFKGKFWHKCTTGWAFRLAQWFLPCLFRFNTASSDPTAADRRWPCMWFDF